MSSTNEGLVVHAPIDPKKMRTMRIDAPLWDAATEALKPFGMSVSGLARLAMDAVSNDPHEVLMQLCLWAPDYAEIDGPNWTAYYARQRDSAKSGSDREPAADV